MEQLTETENVSKTTSKLRLKLREDFWILKLDTLSPKGLNQELIRFKIQGLLLQFIFYYSTAAMKKLTIE